MNINVNINDVMISMESWGAVFCLISMFCVLVEGKVKERKNLFPVLLFLMLSVLTAADAATWILEGNATGAYDAEIYLAVTVEYLISFALLPLLFFYLSHLLARKGKKLAPLWEYLMWGIFAMGILLTLLQIFTHFLFYVDEKTHLYVETEFSWLTMLCGGIGLILLVGAVFFNLKYLSKLMRAAFIVYTLLPLLTIAVQMTLAGTIWSELPLLNIMLSVSGLVLFFFHQAERSQRLRAQDIQIAEEKNSVMMSGIQPELLFESLSNIQEMIQSDPENAYNTTGALAEFLHGSMRAVSTDRCIPIEREMGIVRNYVSLERKHLGDEFELLYNIEYTDFEIPPLCVQSIVEYVVNHLPENGIIKGELVISTGFEGKYNYVRIECTGLNNLRGITLETENTAAVTAAKGNLYSMCRGNMEFQFPQDDRMAVLIRVPQI